MKKLLPFVFFFIVNSLMAQTIEIVAGTGVAGYSGDGGNALNAQLNYPRHMVMDNEGNLYFTEQNNHIIRKISVNGIISTIAGTGLAGYTGDGGQALQARLNNPRGIDIALDGTIYIGDTDNNVIRKIDPSGIITTYAGTGIAGFSGDGGQAAAAELNSPRGVYLDSNGDLFVADLKNQRVRKINIDGIITTYAGSGTNWWEDGIPADEALIERPYDIIIYNNNTYIADIESDRIRRVDESGNIHTIIDTNFSLSASDFAFDTEGNMFISSLQGKIFEVDINGNFSIVVEDSGLFLTSGLLIDTNGDILVSDTDNNQIKRVLKSTLSTVDRENESDISVYTVKENKSIIVEIKSNLLVYNVLIYDINGRQLNKLNHDSKRSSGQNHFEHFVNAAGFYFLKIETNNGVVIKKVVI